MAPPEPRRQPPPAAGAPVRWRRAAGAAGHQSRGQPRVAEGPPRVVADAEQVLDQLAERGCRLTSPRRAVVVALVERTPVGAQALYEALLATGRGVGRATVFRTLDLLEDFGLIERVHAADGCHAYRPVRRTHLHYLVCTDCGARVDLPDCPLEAWLGGVAARTDFLVEGHELALYGRCPDCRGPGLIGTADGPLAQPATESEDGRASAPAAGRPAPERPGVSPALHG
jgi:Fur family ferric uptake transcriptional regulator